MLRNISGGLRRCIRGLMHENNPLLVTLRHFFCRVAGIFMHIHRLMIRVRLLLIRMSTDAAEVASTRLDRVDLAILPLILHR